MRRVELHVTLVRLMVLRVEILQGGLHLLAEVINLGLDYESGPVLVLAINPRLLIILLMIFMGSARRSFMDLLHDLVALCLPMIVEGLWHMISEMFLNPLVDQFLAHRELKSIWTGRRIEG